MTDDRLRETPRKERAEKKPSIVSSTSTSSKKKTPPPPPPPPLFPNQKQGFLKSWGMILVSEIGDKTFFIAAIMAMKHPQKLVFAGAMAALATMTALSAFLGWAAPALISKRWTHWAAVALFFVFGARSLWEGLAGDGGVSRVVLG